MIHKEAVDIIKNKLREKCQYGMSFCEECEHSSSKKHQGVWCSKCPGKMKKYYGLTWANILLRCEPGSAGGYNNFCLELGIFDDGSELWKVWRESKVINRSNILKWAEKIDNESASDNS